MYYTTFNPDDMPYIAEIFRKIDLWMIWTGKGDPGDCYLSIIRQNNGAPVGSFELTHIDFINRSATFGVVTTDEHLGKAFVRLILQFLKETYDSGIETIYTKVPVHNKHAFECNEFIGFREEKRDSAILGDITYGIIIMSLSKENFERKWSSWVGQKQYKQS